MKNSFIKIKDFSEETGFSIRMLRSYEEAWGKFLPKILLKELTEFSKNDMGQLLGQHEVVIRTTFNYLGDAKKGEIIIPYTPIYAVS